MLGLSRVERTRQAGPHVAERAGPRAGIPHDHEGRVFLLPAFADVGAARLLADGDQPMLAYDRSGLGIARGARGLDANPVRLLRNRLVRTVCLLWMPKRD